MIPEPPANLKKLPVVAARQKFNHRQQAVAADRNSINSGFNTAVVRDSIRERGETTQNRQRRTNCAVGIF